MDNKEFTNSFFRHLVSAYHKTYQSPLIKDISKPKEDTGDIKEKLLSIEKKILKLKNQGYTEKKLELLQTKIEKLKDII